MGHVMNRRIGAAILAVTCSITAVRAFPPPQARPTPAKSRGPQCHSHCLGREFLAHQDTLRTVQPK